MSIDGEIMRLITHDSNPYEGLTWQDLRTKINAPDSEIATRIKSLQESGQIIPVVIYILASS